MNFLVTGAGGFIGANLAERLLEEGHSVWGFDDLNDFYSPAQKERNIRELEARGRFTFIRGDLRRRPEVNAAFDHARFDQVVHLAARAGVPQSLREPALYLEVNVTGTAHLLEAAREAGVKKVTIASSSSVYGVNQKVPFAESDPVLMQISPYAASKLACEALGHAYHHIHGMDIAMLRFFTAYGPRQRPDLAIHKFAERMRAGQPIPVYGDGSSGRDYTYVTDTISGIVACTRRELGYEVFNLGEGECVTLARVIELLEAKLGVKAIIDRQPVQPGDIPTAYADITKARRMLGYDPKVKIEKGIGLFIDWFLANRA